MGRQVSRLGWTSRYGLRSCAVCQSGLYVPPTHDSSWIRTVQRRNLWRTNFIWRLPSVRHTENHIQGREPPARLWCASIRPCQRQCGHLHGHCEHFYQNCQHSRRWKQEKINQELTLEKRENKLTSYFKIPSTTNCCLLKLFIIVRN